MESSLVLEPASTLDASKPLSDEETLESLVTRAQEGNSQAFDEVVKRTRSLVKRTAYPLLGAAQVEDAVQETYIIVYQKLHHLRDPKAFQGWLVRIALHASYLLRKKTPLVSEAEPSGASADASLAVASRLDLKAALNKLKEDERNVLILREMLGFSYEEVAYSLRLPLGTVRSRLHYGRKKLAELLKN